MTQEELLAEITEWLEGEISSGAIDDGGISAESSAAWMLAVLQAQAGENLKIDDEKVTVEQTKEVFLGYRSDNTILSVVADAITTRQEEKRVDGGEPKRVSKRQVKDRYVAELRRAGWIDTERYDEDAKYRQHIAGVFDDAYSSWQKFGAGSTTIDELNPKPIDDFISYFGEDYALAEEPVISGEQYDAKLQEDASEKEAKGAAALRTSLGNARTDANNRQTDADDAEDAKVEAEKERARVRELSDRRAIRRNLSDKGLITPNSTPQELVEVRKLEDAIYAELELSAEQGFDIDFDTRVETRVSSYAAEKLATNAATNRGGIPQLTEEVFLAQSDAQLAALRDKARHGTLTPEEQGQVDYLTRATNQLRGVESLGELIPLTPEQKAQAEELARDLMEDASETDNPISFDVALGRARAELGFDKRAEAVVDEVSLGFLGAAGGGTAGAISAGGGSSGAGQAGGVGLQGVDTKAKFVSEGEHLATLASKIGLKEFGDEDVPFLRSLRKLHPDTDFTAEYDRFNREREYRYNSEQAAFDQQTAMDSSGRMRRLRLRVPTFTDPVYGSPGGAQGSKQTAQAPEPLIPVSFTEFTRTRRDKLRKELDSSHDETARLELEKVGATRDRQAGFGARS